MLISNLKKKLRPGSKLNAFEPKKLRPGSKLNVLEPWFFLVQNGSWDFKINQLFRDYFDSTFDLSRNKAKIFFGSSGSFWF